jgi:GrpB-like predicted nucleotidyltransferase (UPF0157 family)
MRAKHLIIVDYNPAWPELFEQEKAHLLAALGDRVETIEHFGSTSVPGLAAKPVIDILIGVRDLAEVERFCIAAITGLRYFRRSDADGVRTHHVHLWPLDHPDYDRHIVFRDYLRTHPDEAAAYEAVKRELITQFDDGNDYAEAKSVFVLPCEERAFAWRAGLDEPAASE